MHKDTNSLTLSAWQNEYQGWLALAKAKAASGIFNLESRKGLSCLWFRGYKGMENILLANTIHPGLLHTTLEALQPILTDNAVSTDLRFPDNDKLASVAEQNNFVFQRNAPIMCCSFNEISEQESSYDIQRVPNTSNLAAVLKLVKNVYGDPSKLTAFFHSPEVVMTYVAYHQERVVASSTLWPFSDMAGIYSVATHPDFRRKGLASAIIRHMLTNAKRQGFSHACLRTTPELVPFYEQLRFNVVGFQSQWRFSK